MKVRRATISIAIALLALVAGFSCQKPAPVIEPPPIVVTDSGAEMVSIPAGAFMMGSDGNLDDEAPAHEVWVDAFLMDRYEVTQDLYSKFVPTNGSHFKGPDLPVEQINWTDAALFCNLRSKAEGLEPCYDENTAECNFEATGYRLPTEAEWEYACRAGTTTDYSFGNDPRQLKDYAWFDENGGDTTHPAGQKRPNPWGLYDLHGNVAEWCNDPYDENAYKNSPAKNPRGPASGKDYVLRGGAWAMDADTCRSAARIAENPGFQDACFARDAIGFRCVRKAPVTTPGSD